MRLSQGLWNSNAENADEVVWFVHTDRFQGFHSYDHYLQFWLDKRSLLRWYKTAYRFWENKKETAEIASRCCKNYSLTLQESGETPCLEVKCDFEHTLHFTLDLVLFLRYSLSCARRFTRWSSMARRQCSFGCSSRASFSTTWPQWLTQGDQTTSKHSTFADGVSFYLFRFIIDSS